MTEKCFKPLFRRCMKLDEDLSRDDCAIGLDPKTTAKLCQDLGDRYYTYLVISDGTCDEVIRVEQVNGLLYIERGLDKTPVSDWPCGADVTSEVTYSGLKDMKQEVEEHLACPEETFSGEVKNGNCVVIFKDGVAVKEKPLKRQIQDGCYDNPVLTFKHGCIVRVAKGANRTARFTPSCSKDRCEKCD